MSLFNDGRITTAEDLVAMESSILDVTSTEGIELDKKIEIATREVGAQITDFLLNFGDDPKLARDLSGVVVTDALRGWHVAHTLAVIFRDAHGSQLNDRYAAKWNAYDRLSRQACRLFFDIGVGISNDPIPAAATPVCGTLNGAELPSGDFAIQVCWKSGRGTVGGLSDPVVTHVNAGQLLTVKAIHPPPNAAGWNLYVSRTGDIPMRQNTSAIATGAVWIMSVDGLSRGPAPETGDILPDFYVTRCRIFRG